jgi:hypothetical protein
MLYLILLFFSILYRVISDATPVDIALTTLSDTSVLVEYSPPDDTFVYSYKVEYDTDPGVQEVQSITTSTYTYANEIQSVTISAEDINEKQKITTYADSVSEVQSILVTRATGGYFFLELDTSSVGGSLQYSGYIDVGFPANSSTDGKDVASIISSMKNIPDDVTVTMQTLNAENYQYTITFPPSMGNVPLMIPHFSDLTPANIATVEVVNEVEGNVLSGSFKLSFNGEITSDIPYDATEDTMRKALVALSNINSVEVTRSEVDYQRGYSWVIEFISPLNDGNLPELVVASNGLSVSSSGAGSISIDTLKDGNEINGFFYIEYNGAKSGAITYDASSEEFKNALEATSGNAFPTGSVAVSRTGPDGQLGYTWLVTFLQDSAGTFEGNVGSLSVSDANVTGSNITSYVSTINPGTVQEVQLIRVTASSAVSSTTFMQLEYNGAKTIPILVKPANGVCMSSSIEVQTITTSTVDSTGSGGDFDVSMYLKMRLKYGE